LGKCKSQRRRGEDDDDERDTNKIRKIEYSKQSVVNKDLICGLMFEIEHEQYQDERWGAPFSQNCHLPNLIIHHPPIRTRLHHLHHPSPISVPIAGDPFLSSFVFCHSSRSLSPLSPLTPPLTSHPKSNATTDHHHRTPTPPNNNCNSTRINRRCNTTQYQPQTRQDKRETNHHVWPV